MYLFRCCIACTSDEDTSGGCFSGEADCCCCDDCGDCCDGCDGCDCDD